jgi:Protein of unknown function (DUF1656)
MMLLTAGVSHKTAPLAVRERLAVQDSELVAVARSLKPHLDLDELVLIPCSIAAVFPHADEATLEAVGKFDRWIHCGQPELNVAGLLVPWIMFVGALGFLAAWLVMAILERTGLSRHLWHLPLFFVALLVLFSSLIGALFFP